MPRILIFLSGLLFGAGISLSGMINPLKVQNFMDLAGAWDPTLIFVMGGGLFITFLGYRVAFKQSAPWFAPRFHLPPAAPADLPLLGGAALFGLGWGLSGFCPGPAVASLVLGRSESFVFVACMALGMLLVKSIRSRYVLPEAVKENAP